MHFMVIHEEAPASPLAAFLARWRRELDAAGALGLALDFAPSADAARLSLWPDGERVELGPFADAGTGVAGFTVIAATTQEEAAQSLAHALAAAGVIDATFELRETGCPGGSAGIPPAAAGAGRRWAVLLRSTAATERDEVEARHKLDALNAFNAVQAGAGVLLAGDGLKSTARGKRVRAQGGQPAIIDGPFAEAKELIAGFWMVQAPTVDAAIAWARRVPYPTGPYVELEIREVVASGTAAELAPGEARLEQGLRTESLDAAMRAELAAQPAWR
jgi:hypothetical protein